MRQWPASDVMTDDRMVGGVVSRVDLSRSYARSDTAIRQDVINHVLRRTLWIDTRQVQVHVDAGVVTLTGTVGRRTTAAIAARLTAQVPGVVAVAPAHGSTGRIRSAPNRSSPDAGGTRRRVPSQQSRSRRPHRTILMETDGKDVRPGG
jgi:hypothetical protein